MLSESFSLILTYFEDSNPLDGEDASSGLSSAIIISNWGAMGFDFANKLDKTGSFPVNSSNRLYCPISNPCIIALPATVESKKLLGARNQGT